MIGKKAATAQKSITKKQDVKKDRVFSDLGKNYQLYLMVLIPILYVFVFKYIPMYGAQIAFKDYSAAKGILGSDWVGFKHFIRFFKSPQFFILVRNTIFISVYSILVSIPFPVILAIGLNYVRSVKLKKTVQMITYMPHFLSTVIIVSFIMMLFNTQSGVVNNIIYHITGERINFLGSPKYYRHLYVWSGCWQSVGWSSILYVSALAGVDPALHEAAMIDGASKWKRIWHIDLPCILPTLAIMIVKSMGTILSVGFDKTFLMQNPTNLDVSEVFSTFEYKRGVAASIPDYSYPTAIGLVTAVITFCMVTLSNKISNKLSGYGLW
ncbi:MAG: ABC transporter permease [Clostridia bacterium]